MHDLAAEVGMIVCCLLDSNYVVRNKFFVCGTLREAWETYNKPWNLESNNNSNNNINNGVLIIYYRLNQQCKTCIYYHHSQTFPCQIWMFMFMCVLPQTAQSFDHFLLFSLFGRFCVCAPLGRRLTRLLLARRPEGIHIVQVAHMRYLRRDKQTEKRCVNEC